MAFDNQSFIQKLRMNNIFPPEGQGLPNPLIGMPNFEGGRRGFGFQQGYGNGGGNLGGIGKSIQNEPLGPKSGTAFGRSTKNAPNSGGINEPMGVVYKAPRSDQYATDILMGETPRDKDIALKSLIASQKNNLGQGNLAIAQRKQALAEKVASGKATDAEKQQYALDLVDAKGDVTSDQITQRGDITSRQIGERGTVQKDLQSTKGNQALEQIGARVAGQQSLQDSKPPSFTQQGAQQDNAIKQMMLTRPDLAAYVIQDTGGRVTVNPSAPLAAVAEINKLIYGDPSVDTLKDISLPSTKTSGEPPSKILKTPTSKTPTAKPTAAELLKKYGG